MNNKNKKDDKLEAQMWMMIATTIDPIRIDDVDLSSIK